MEQNINKLKENIKYIVSFGLYRGAKIGTFQSIERDLGISKKEIIEIFELFGKAKIFYYKLLPLESEEEDKYDLGSRIQRYEFYTGRFKLFVYREMVELISLEDKLFIPEKLTGLKHSEIVKKIKILKNKIDKRNKNNENILSQKILESLIKSPQALNDFIRKNKKSFVYNNIPYYEKNKIFGNFKINLITGDYIYNKTKGNFNPKTQEYKLIYSLITDPDYQMDYGKLSLGVFSEDKQICNKRRKLYDIVKNIHVKLNVLPKKKNNNPKLLKGVANFGYKLIK